MIAVTREWSVVFAPLGRGYRLEGSQVSVAVEAPSNLQALADIERNRVEAGFLPLMLSDSGLIVDQGGETSENALRFALAQAGAMIEASQLDGGDKQAATAFLRRLHHTASQSINRLPDDFLLPRILDFTDQRDISLDGGLGGTLEVSFAASLDQAGECLARSERKVATRLGDSALHSREVWVVNPA
ncbi:hypothetical protein [Parerythrobacter lacustris]|nr:hypothetical protein [Parerythrobacter lacustris]